jgi:probable HAF family extracellular repeat protein
LSGDDGTTAFGINDAGQVVGISMPYETGLGTAFITDANGENMRALSTGQVGPYSVTGLSINSSGQVLLGSLDASHGLEQTFITGINGVGATLVGSLIEGGSTFGYGINDAGQITGRSAVADPEGFFGSAHAFLTDANGLNIHDLGTLGGNASMGYGVNASGQVVGDSTVEGDGATHAFITGAHGAGMVDLNSLVTLEDGAVLVGALAVNDLGQVLAYDQNSRSYLLSPFAVPEPGTYGLMLLGLCGVAVAVRRQKAPTA